LLLRRPASVPEGEILTSRNGVFAMARLSALDRGCLADRAALPLSFRSFGSMSARAFLTTGSARLPQDRALVRCAVAIATGLTNNRMISNGSLTALAPGFLNSKQRPLDLRKKAVNFIPTTSFVRHNNATAARSRPFISRLLRGPAKERAKLPEQC
jgi:hypothetical protein